MIEALRVDERATWLIQMYSHDDDNLMTYAFNDESTPIEFECDNPSGQELVTGLYLELRG